MTAPPRFLLVALVSGLAGPFLRRRTLWGLFVLAWGLFYAWYFASMAGA